jgi:hypothetical protein
LNQNVITHLSFPVGSSPARPRRIGGMQDDGTRLRVGTTTCSTVVGGDGSAPT